MPDAASDPDHCMATTFLKLTKRICREPESCFRQATIRLTIRLLLGWNLSASAGEISEYFRNTHTNLEERFKAFDANSKSRTMSQVWSTNHGVTEIGIERAGSVWGGPMYTFIARADGTFRYRGEKGVQRTGEYTGTFPVYKFHELAKFIRDSGYMGFNDEYSRTITDQATTFTTVVMDGKRKVISNYANTGPTSLWAIETLIDELMTKADWKAGLPKPSKPALPSVTKYDSDPVLRTAYLASYQQGYSDAWDRKEKLPVSGPTAEVDKARVFGYSDGMVAGRQALAKWFGTNSSPVSATNTPASKR